MLFGVGSLQATLRLTDVAALVALLSTGALALLTAGTLSTQGGYSEYSRRVR